MYKIYEELRNEKGVTDYRVAKETNLNPSMLSNWKHGIYQPKIDKLMKIAEYFGVSVEKFLKGEK